MSVRVRGARFHSGFGYLFYGIESGFIDDIFHSKNSLSIFCGIVKYFFCFANIEQDFFVISQKKSIILQVFNRIAFALEELVDLYKKDLEYQMSPVMSADSYVLPIPEKEDIEGSFETVPMNSTVGSEEVEKVYLNKGE